MKEFSYTSHRVIKYSIITLFFLTLQGCFEEEKNQAIAESYISEASVFLNAEKDDFVGWPVQMNVTSDRLFFADAGFEQITEVDLNGNKMLSFGRKGRGPGEFNSLANFWIFTKNILLYDYNGFKFINYTLSGDLIEEITYERNPVNPNGSPPNIPLTVEAITEHKFLIPTRGKEGSLFAIADLKTGELDFIGDAVGKYVQFFDDEEVIRAYEQGENPEVFHNLILLSTTPSAIYSLQQTTGVLEKYTHSGERIWSKALNLSIQKDLFEQISQANQNISSDEEPFLLFNYAWAMDAHETGVAILLNLFGDKPETAIWVPEDGGEISQVTFRGVTRHEHGRFGSFALSPDKSTIWFLDSQAGIIYNAEWPLN